MFMKRYKKIKEHVVPESDYIILVEDKILDLGVGVENGHYEEEYFELVPLNRARIQEQAEREIAMEEANEILELETNERAELSPMAKRANKFMIDACFAGKEVLAGELSEIVRKVYGEGIYEEVKEYVTGKKRD